MAATRDEWRSDEGISGDEGEEEELVGGEVAVYSSEASGSGGRRGELVAPSSSTTVQIRDDALALFQSHYLNNFLADPAPALLTLRSSYSIIRYADIVTLPGKVLCSRTSLPLDLRSPLLA